MSGEAIESEISLCSQNIAAENDFVVKSCKFLNEGLGHVKVALIQTKFNCKNENFVESQKEFFDCVIKMLVAASEEGANIVAFPELFSMPYPFYTPNLIDWQEFIEVDQTLDFLQRMAKKFKFVVIGSILEKERDEVFNTCTVISSEGESIGKYRKHHIPPIEVPHLCPGKYESPVFETEFGKIGILICYERHFPLKWLILAQKGAKIIFNPSSEDEKSLSERMWFIENLNAAVSSGIFTVSINRCGEEIFGASSFNYFGSSYVASPFGFISPHLSRQRGVLIADLDLSLTERAREEISFHRNQNMSDCVNELREIQMSK